MASLNTQQRKISRRQRKIKSEIFAVRITDELKAGLEQIAEREDRPLASVARFAFREYIERHGFEKALELVEPAPALRSGNGPGAR